jgi:hypothetical protein
MSYVEVNPQELPQTELSIVNQASLDIVASVQIEAESRRVLYALAMPEYIEAWLKLPEVDRVECYPDRRSFDRFRIDLFSSDECRGCIFGSCHLSKPDKITYLWERDRAGGCAKSIVEMRLCSGPGRCILKLRHSGFQSRAESQWHSTMWRYSLKNLCGLMEGIRTAVWSNCSSKDS